MTFLIRPAVPADLPALLGLEGLFPSDHISRRQFRYHMSNPRAVLCVAVPEKGGAAVGYALFLMREGGRARFYSLIVQPQMQGRGLGRQLCRAGLEALELAGITVVGLEVDAADAGAIGLYASLGFTETARVEGYYEDGRDAVQMIFRKA